MFNKDSIYAFLVAVFFASLGIFAKYIYRYENITPDITFFYSLFFSLLVLFSILLMKYKGVSFLKKIDRKNLAVVSFNTALVGLFLTNLLILKSLQFIDPGVQKVLVYSNPIFCLIINGVVWKKFQKRDLITIFFIIVGLILIVEKIGKSQNIVLGVVLSIFAAFFIALYSSVEENIKKEKIDALIYWFYAFLVATSYMTIYLLAVDEFANLKYIFSNQTLLVLLLSCAVVSFVLPYLCFLKSIETVGATKTAIISSISPIVAILISMLLFGENLTFSQGVGVVLIVGSTIFSSLK